MKLEKNMYVRTIGGVIGKITNEDYTYSKSWIIDTLYYNFDEDVDKWTCGVKEYKILKASHNIIDLIEVGDYVNGILVKQLPLCKNDFIYGEEVDGIKPVIGVVGAPIENNEDGFVKSIVTKEQFESMSYKVQ